MATLGAAQGPRLVELKEEGQTLAHLGAVHGFDDETVKLIMATVGSECRTKAEKSLFLARAEAEGLSPIKQEIYAVRKSNQDGTSDLTFIISYLACISRAAQAGYELHCSNAVCAEDEWTAWDAGNGLPSGHLIYGGDRGAVVGAYATWRSRADNYTRGWFWSGKECFPGESLVSGNLGEHMAMKTAIGRSARLLVPSLMTSLYLAEELGFRESENAGKLDQVVADTHFQGPSKTEKAKTLLADAVEVSLASGDAQDLIEAAAVSDPEQTSFAEDFKAEAKAHRKEVTEPREGTIEELGLDSGGLPAPPKELAQFLAIDVAAAIDDNVLEGGDSLFEWAGSVTGRTFETFRGTTVAELAALKAALGGK